MANKKKLVLTCYIGLILIIGVFLGLALAKERQRILHTEKESGNQETSDLYIWEDEIISAETKEYTYSIKVRKYSEVREIASLSNNTGRLHTLAVIDDKNVVYERMDTIVGNDELEGVYVYNFDTKQTKKMYMPDLGGYLPASNNFAFLTDDKFYVTQTNYGIGADRQSIKIYFVDNAKLTSQLVVDETVLPDSGHVWMGYIKLNPSKNRIILESYQKASVIDIYEIKNDQTLSKIATVDDLLTVTYDYPLNGRSYSWCGDDTILFVDLANNGEISMYDIPTQSRSFVAKLDSSAKMISYNYYLQSAVVYSLRDETDPSMSTGYRTFVDSTVIDMSKTPFVATNQESTLIYWLDSVTYSVEHLHHSLCDAGLCMEADKIEIYNTVNKSVVDATDLLKNRTNGLTIFD